MPGWQSGKPAAVRVTVTAMVIMTRMALRVGMVSVANLILDGLQRDQARETLARRR